MFRMPSRKHPRPPATAPPAQTPQPTAGEEQWEPPEDLPGGWKCAHGCGSAPRWSSVLPQDFFRENCCVRIPWENLLSTNI